MILQDVAEDRLRRQRLTRGARATAAEVVAWFGAVQAQEYAPARWALALRMREGTTDARLTRAFDDGEILRTHVLRPTWHFVTPADIRWMLALTGPNIKRLMAVYERALGLDRVVIRRAARVIERALRDETSLMRSELADRIERAGLTVRGERLGLILMHAELDGVVCSGPRRGRQFTYALLDRRAPAAPARTRDESLADLSRRFLRSHGPATVRDFMWWSGLAAADARRGLDMIAARPLDIGGRAYWTVGPPPAGMSRDDLAHLLPIYDEYLVAYRDRDAVPHGPAVVGTATGTSVTFQHALILDGQVAGTWRVTPKGDGVRVDVTPLRPLSARERQAVEHAAHRYARFLAKPVSLVIARR